ncbi:hypothetical protein IP91_01446 [Pseudoduganella lurida]|uniref:Uncharacterized protein n=1 Tax=Pseudoduganella lurida TaxID=1036180 RepID=A0A562REI8_9BURK|nr:hypothetical protein IP91_01446 [Pseudoduganella lurida]
MPEIRIQNWIYIFVLGKIPSSLNANASNPFKDTNMTTATATLTNASTGNFTRLLNAFLAEVRRAVELAGAPYMNGPVPPM